jgi:L-threonylcarbamoyladenylate synthase
VNVGLKTPILPAGEAAAAAAARSLDEGGLVAFPTETVYGLGADATNPAAIARLYQAKGRPAFNPLIAHVGDIAAAQLIARFDDAAMALAEAFWPGPLTLVLPKTDGCAVADLATAGLDTIAIRIPAHPVARDILRLFGRPVAAPSANLSGHVSPTTAAHVESDLSGRIDLIVDGGPPRSNACSAGRCCNRLSMPTATAGNLWRRACWPPITRRAHASGFMLIGSSPARHCSRSASEQFRELTPLPQ